MPFLYYGLAYLVAGATILYYHVRKDPMAEIHYEALQEQPFIVRGLITTQAIISAPIDMTFAFLIGLFSKDDDFPSGGSPV